MFFGEVALEAAEGAVLPIPRQCRADGCARALCWVRPRLRRCALRGWPL